MDNDKTYIIDLTDNLSPKLIAADDAAKQLEQTLQLINVTANTLGYSFQRAFDTQKITDFVSAAASAYGYITQANAQMAGIVSSQMQQLPKEAKEGFMSTWKEVMEFGNTMFDFAGHAKDLLDKGKGLATAYSKVAEAKKLSAAGSMAMAEAEGVEATATTEAAAAQTALDVAMDAFPGMLIVTALSALVGWAISASSSVDEVKDSYMELHSVVKETGDVEEKASDSYGGRIAPLQTELALVKDYQKTVADTYKSEADRNNALKEAREHWKNLKDLGGAFTKDLSDTDINIEKATADMDDFGNAIKAAAFKMAATEEESKNFKDYMDLQIKAHSNETAVPDAFAKDGNTAFAKSKELYNIEDGSEEEMQLRNDLMKNGGGGAHETSTFMSGTDLENGVKKFNEWYLKRAELSMEDTNSFITQNIIVPSEKLLNGLSKSQKDTVNKKTSGDNTSFTSPDNYNPNNGNDTKASGSKNISIKIDIKELVHEFKINTSNFYESANKVKDLVAQALISAVNDSEMGEY